MSEEDETYLMALIRDGLTAAVDKRMMSDRPIGCLVSGGVDSSLVAALVARHYDVGELHTFTVGLKVGASDRGYARMVADHIGSTHHEILLTKEQALALLEETVQICETWDTTTIRASSMQLAVSRYISEHTDIKVVFNGDVIDEASGSYVYFKNAPSPKDYQEETVRLMKEIHLFDVLRTDRTVSGCGLEARLPFGDLDFLQCICPSRHNSVSLAKAWRSICSERRLMAISRMLFYGDRRKRFPMGAASQKRVGVRLLKRL